jgi:hypothetical protein
LRPFLGGVESDNANRFFILACQQVENDGFELGPLRRLLVTMLIADAAQNGLGREYQSVTEGLVLVMIRRPKMPRLAPPHEAQDYEEAAHRP